MRNLFTWLGCYLLGSLVVSAPSACAEPTPAEELAQKLRKTDDHTLEQLSSRFYDLIRLQEWSDVTGRFTVRAKFVAHDADQDLVKLIVVKGRGAERSEREASVPLGKLSRECQSRVRRIVRMHPKLEEKLAAFEAAAEEEEENPGRSEGYERGSGEERGYGEQDGYGDERGAPPPRRRRPPNERRASDARDAADGRIDPRSGYDEGYGEEYGYETDAPRGRSGEDAFGYAEDRDRYPTDPERRGSFGAEAVDQPPSARSRRPSGPPIADYVTDIAYDPAEFPYPRDESWKEFPETWGEGTSLAVRMIPDKTVADEPAKLQLTVYDSYGRFEPLVMVRMKKATAEVGQSYAERSSDWVEMKLVGTVTVNTETGVTAPLDNNRGDYGTESLPVESHYQLGLHLPAGKFRLEFELEKATPSTDAGGYRGLDVTVLPSASATPAEAVSDDAAAETAAAATAESDRADAAEAAEEATDSSPVKTSDE